MMMLKFLKKRRREECEHDRIGNLVPVESLPTADGGHTTVSLVRCARFGCNAVIDFSGNIDLVEDSVVSNIADRLDKEGLTLVT